MRAIALILAALAAGCSGPGVEGESWDLHGSFTTERTQADIDAWCEVAKAYENECVLMESFPEQFLLRFPTEAQCREALGRILAIPHTRSDGCRHLRAD